MVLLLIAVLAGLLVGCVVGTLFLAPLLKPPVPLTPWEQTVAMVETIPKPHFHEYDFNTSADTKGLRCKQCWDAGVYTPHPEGKWQATSS